MAALNAHRGFGTSDIAANTSEISFSELLTAAIASELTILPYVNEGQETNEVEFKWVEQDLNPFVVTTSAGYAPGVTTIVLTAGQGKFVRDGAVLQSTTLSGQVNELLQVQANGVSTDTLTVARGINGTTAVTLASGEVLTIISQPLEDNSDLQKDLTRARRGKSNYTQIFERSVDVSRRQIKRGMVAVANEFSKSVKDRTFEAKRELELAMLFGRALTSGTKDGDGSLMNGIIQMLTDTGDTKVSANQTTLLLDNGAATMTEQAFNGWVANVKAQGGKVSLALTAEKQARKFSGPSFIGAGSSGVKYSPSDRVRGAFVRQYLSDSGYIIDLLSNPFIRADMLMLLNPELLTRHAFVGSSWFMINADTLRDGKAARLIGDYTLKLEHAGESHLIVRNLG